jgi:putative ATP-dependent endonuclease of the OLD family
MPIKNIKFRGYRCFVSEWSGFDEYKPVNVIIGRNNVGKSQLLDLVRMSCGLWPKAPDSTIEFALCGSLSEGQLRGVFQPNTSGGDLGGPHWEAHGAHFVDAQFSWVRTKDAVISEISIDESYNATKFGRGTDTVLSKPRLDRLTSALERLSPPLFGRTFRHLLADRDVQAESAVEGLSLSPNGNGATNVIRRHITSSSMRRELVQEVLLEALNTVFGIDGQFTEIQARQHDGKGVQNGPWEVYLGQAHKGLVPLSASGSGLKTVLLVLLHLHVMPQNEGRSAAESVFAFEELENNLHPSLLRRLLTYIEEFAVANESKVFLTTHSNVALDLFGASDSAQIVHVTHDGETAKTATVRAHFDKLGVVSELGARPSDLLQANGIIWVEGPSDAIHLNRWIELISDGRFREGRNYLCAFYGGSLLARTQFVGEEKAESEFVNLLRVNPNVVVVCDSDRTSATTKLKPRVQRIKAELERVPGAVLWITQPKEIEGYLSGALLSRALKLGKTLRDPDQFELIFPSSDGRRNSYLETTLNRSSIDKISLAAKCGVAELPDLIHRFDWHKKMLAILGAIERWNR